VNAVDDTIMLFAFFLTGYSFFCIFNATKTSSYHSAQLYLDTIMKRQASVLSKVYQNDLFMGQ
jgi:hypothetical protein